MRHAARAARAHETTQPSHEPEPFTSWRNPRAVHYRTPVTSFTFRMCRWARNLTVLIVLLLLTTAAVLPSLAMHPASQAVHHLRDSTAFVNFGAAEIQQAQREQLERLKTIPHDPAALAKQFEHGINSHLPDGVVHRVNTARYMTDEQTQLVIDRVPGVTEEQFNQLLTMLRDMAPKCVAYSLDDLSGYTGTEPPLRIVLNTTASIRKPARRNWSQAESDVIDKKCRELVSGLHPVCIRLSESDYSSNPILAIKRAPDGTWSDQRFCVNYIPINRHTEPDQYSAHRAEDLFARVVNAKFLTALDLRSGYHQIPMHPDSVSTTAFWWATHTTPPQLLAYQRMPFGLKNAPAKFQRVMDHELERGGCSGFAFAYIDDIIIASDTWEEHVEHVAKVLKTLEACNLKIHPQKSVFATNVVEYLGHNVVGQHGLTMNEAKVQAIKALPTPTNQSELRSILGFLAYYRHFIPGYSSLTAPLNKLLQNQTPFVWGPEQRAAYQTLRDLMVEPGRVLRPVDRNRELILHTDWSVHGIGAVLGQKNEDGNEYMCACISRSLNKHERNYPSYKGELLALAWAVRMFRQHLHGVKFRLVTDHQPLKWLMDARDLNGQYARWQMLLQEYDFQIEHRAGVKHANADVLSRFPQPQTFDDSGAQLDADIAAPCDSYTPFVAKRWVETPCNGISAHLNNTGPTALQQQRINHSNIDTFCPKFKDVFDQGNAHVDEFHYADGVMRENAPPDAALTAAIDRAAVAAAPRMQQAITDAIKAANTAHPTAPLYEAASIDNSVIARSFFHNAAHDGGIGLVELCGGICATLEAMLKAGIRVKQYFYCDKDPVARRVARFRVENLSALYPDLFPVYAWENAFNLPQDITQIQPEHLGVEGLLDIGHQWLITAGWPCQDYSSAGLGALGQRAALLHDVIRIVKLMQLRHRDKPPAYLLENVAMQHNFRHQHIKFPVYEKIVTMLGEPVTFDAAQAGSYAHRLRNYWSNLAHPARLQPVLDQLDVPHEHILNELLDPGRHTKVVRANERTISGRQYNVPGKPRVILPTLMSFPKSRAFRVGRPGCIFDVELNQFDEPSANEREVIMGFEPSSTAAPDVSEQERKSLLGQAIDLNALVALITAMRLLNSRHRTALMPNEKLVASVTEPTLPKVNRINACCHWDHDSAAHPDPCAPVNPDHDVRQDIWLDNNTLEFIKTQRLPTDPSEVNRVRKRALLFRWFNNRLFKVVKDRLTGNPVHRIVPQPKDRESLIMTMHKQLGHVGEKRTIAAMATIYWWHGMTIDVRRMLSTCKTCRRVGVSPPAAQQEMQTEPHDYGLFYRWGLDYVGELTPSAQGNQFALICIDYFSKWIEVFPVKNANSRTTMNLVLMNIIARYGTPAEFVCDNGPPFQGEFEKFCADRRINIRFITPGMPRTNGLAERAVKTIKHALQKHAAEKHNALTWDTEGLANILLGYRVTPQASSQVSPAQVLYAQNPAVNADHHARLMGEMSYDEPELAASQLLFRASVAAKLGAQVAENLKLAHARNAARFKQLRSGLYMPRVYIYRPGDFVYTLNEEDKVPGGALGIRARPDILKVIEVRPTGVLVLENQAGRRIETHKERCVPCLLPNIEGTTHPGLIRPSAKLPCTRCGDHRKGALMLLCDNCDAAYHTYCLNPPLVDVPEGNWICPSCVQAGVTQAQVTERQARYIPAPTSRPNLELPSPQRRRKAQALVDEWHGAVIVRQPRTGEPIHGRVVFQGILEPKWFKVYWEDGTASAHHAGFFRHVGRVDKADAPATVMHKPEPATVLALRCRHTDTHDDSPVNWSIRTPNDLLARMETLMPGEHNAETMRLIHASFNQRMRTKLVKDQPRVAQREIDALFAALDFSVCKTLLDPWAGNPAVSHACRQARIPIVTNDPWGKADLALEPIDVHLYNTVERKMNLDAVVMIPPSLLADIALVTAHYHVAYCVCMYVPVSWITHAPASRMRIIMDHINSNSFIGITTLSNPSHCWACFFTHPHACTSMVRAGQPNEDAGWIVIKA